jgi:hypothetical protein
MLLNLIMKFPYFLTHLSIYTQTQGYQTMYSTYLCHNTWQFVLTSLKKSPIHLAIISVNISGRPKVMLPVASMRITVKLIVIRTTPPSWAAAPTRAYLPGSIHPWQNKFVSGKCQWKNLKGVTITYQINKLIIAIHIHEIQTCYFKAINRIETTIHKCQILFPTNLQQQLTTAPK